MLALLGYVVADVAVRVLPDRVADAVARSIAGLTFAVRPPARHFLECNLARLTPELSPELRRGCARAAFDHFALSIVDFMRLPRLDRDALERAFEVRGAEHLAAARATGRGVIVLSAHLGNWEWGAAFLAARGPNLHVVARPHPSRRVEAWFARRRDARGVRVLPGAPLWSRAARALRRGEWVALMGDRPTRQGASASRRGSWCAGACALARRTGALLLPAVTVRTGPGRYAACFEAPIEPDVAAGDARATIARLLRRTPGQWLAFEPLPDGLA
jgi:KDO2-lipid IV(A) lauroyltransferase